MSLLASFPGGMAAIGWRRLLLTALGCALAPVLVGIIAYVVAVLLGPKVLDESYFAAVGMATLAFVSPLFGLPIWIMIALGAALLLKANHFGTLPAALLGMAFFAVLVRTDIGLISLPFGAVSGILYRMALALQRPEAF